MVTLPHLPKGNLWNIITSGGDFPLIIDNQISDHFSASEFNCGPELLIAHPLLEVLEKIREAWGKPLKINSGFRTQAKQEELTAEGRPTAKVSPHCAGMAADIDTSSKEESEALVRCIHAANLPPHRIGWKQYEALGSTFVHVDVTPQYFAPGKVWHEVPHPASWETNGLEW